MTTGIFLSSTVYYVGSYGYRFIKGQTATYLDFNTLPYNQGLVYSSDMTQTTCYSLSTAAAQASIDMTTISFNSQSDIY